MVTYDVRAGRRRERSPRSVLCMVAGRLRRSRSGESVEACSGRTGSIPRQRTLYRRSTYDFPEDFPERLNPSMPFCMRLVTSQKGHICGTPDSALDQTAFGVVRFRPEPRQADCRDR